MAEHYCEMGTSALVRGEYDEARRSFKESIRLRCKDASQGAARFASIVTETKIQSKPMNIAARLASSETIAAHNWFAMFDRAFVLSRLESHIAFVTACIYNIGLSYHLEAMLYAEESSYHFWKAKRFYETALGALQKAGPEDLDGTFVVVQLALFNNLAHVSCHLCEWNEIEIFYKTSTVLIPHLKYPESNLCHDDAVFFDHLRTGLGLEGLNKAAAA